MQECPNHPGSKLNFVCLTQLCPKRGAVCQKCMNNHQGHQIKKINELLNDLQKTNSTKDDIQEERDLQMKVLYQLDDLKKNIVNAISRLQINSQQSFQQEISIRKVDILDQQRQQELIKGLQLSQNLTGPQVQDKVLELLHRQQAKHPPSALNRYQEVSRRIQQQGKDILDTIVSLMDVQERQLNLSKNQSTISKFPQSPSVQASKFEQKSPNYEKETIPKVKIINTVIPSAISTTPRSEINKNYQSDFPQRSSISSKSKSPIFQTPKRIDDSNQQRNSSSTNKRQLEQKDLAPVGSYTSNKVNDYSKDSSSFYQSQYQNSAQSRESFTITEPSNYFAVKQQKQLLIDPPSPQSEISKSNQQNIKSSKKSQVQLTQPNKDSQDMLHSQVSEQRDRIHQQNLDLDQKKQKFGHSVILKANQDLFFQLQGKQLELFYKRSAQVRRIDFSKKDRLNNDLFLKNYFCLLFQFFKKSLTSTSNNEVFQIFKMNKCFHLEKYRQCFKFLQKGYLLYFHQKQFHFQIRFSYFLI